jgi:hypothetical protein
VSRDLAWPWISLRATGSAGWVDATQTGSGAAERFGAIPTHGVRTSAGAGLGLFYDTVRIEVVRGLGGARVDDPIVGDWAVLLTINPRFWDIL